MAVWLLERGLLLFVAVAVHEMAHVLMAKWFNAPTQRIRFTLLGAAAVISGFVFLKPFEKALVLLAGPLTNIAIGLACLLFPLDFEFFQNANFALGLFNLLPAYPLDGGRLLVLCLEQGAGTLPSNYAAFMVGKVMSAAFVFFGFVQVALYPYNISLLCMGLYTAFHGKRMHFDTAFDFYRYVVIGQAKYAGKRVLPVKTFALPTDTPVKTVINMLGYNAFLIFNALEGGVLVRTFTETDISEYVRRCGVRGSLRDLQNPPQ